MRPGPTNRNVPLWIWEDAERRHKEYLAQHQSLREMGLTEEQADQYLDLSELAARNIELLLPSDDDFRSDDHATHFQQAIGALAKMQSLLGYGTVGDAAVECAIAVERETCAKIAEEVGEEFRPGADTMCDRVAERIRARSL